MAQRGRLDAALPSAVRGPVDFLAFSRLALIWASVGVRGSFVFFIFVSAGAGGPVLTLMLGEGRGGQGGILRKWLKAMGRNFLWGGDWGPVMAGTGLGRPVGCGLRGGSGSRGTRADQGHMGPR